MPGGAYAAVVNPSKIEDLTAFRSQLDAAAQAHGRDPVRWFETTEDDPGYGQTQQAMADGAAVVLACGGDGTVTACASALAGSDRALALIPAGTGNLLARNLELPTSIAPALEIAFGSGRKLIDLVRSEPGRHFVVMAGVGFDASMMAETDEQTKAMLGWPAYIGGVVRAMRQSQAADISIRVDSRPAVRHRGVGILVGNVGHLQAGLSVFPDAKPDDGVLELAVLAPATWRDWPLILGRLLTHRLGAGGRTELLQGTRFDIELDRSLPLEFDGDVFGPTQRLVAAVMPGGLTVCVPA